MYLRITVFTYVIPICTPNKDIFMCLFHLYTFMAFGLLAPYILKNLHNLYLLLSISLFSLLSVNFLASMLLPLLCRLPPCFISTQSILWLSPDLSEKQSLCTWPCHRSKSDECVYLCSPTCCHLPSHNALHSFRLTC